MRQLKLTTVVRHFGTKARRGRPVSLVAASDLCLSAQGPLASGPSILNRFCFLPRTTAATLSVSRHIALNAESGIDEWQFVFIAVLFVRPLGYPFQYYLLNWRFCVMKL